MSHSVYAKSLFTKVVIHGQEGLAMAGPLGAVIAIFVFAITND